MLPIGRLALSEYVGEEQKGRGHGQGYSHNQKRITEESFDLVLEEQADDGDRDHRDDYLQSIVGLVVVTELEDAFENVPDRLAENHQGAQDGREMDHDGEVHEAFGIHAEKLPEDHQVAA